MNVNVQQVVVGLREYNTKMVAGRAREITLYYAQEYIKAAKDLCPVVTGRLRDSIGNPSKEGIYEVSSKGYRINIGTNVPYAPAVEVGVKKPWVIKSKRKALRFKGKDGEYHYAKEVIHPPMQGKFFMTRAMQIAAMRTNVKMGTMIK